MNKFFKKIKRGIILFLIGIVKAFVKLTDKIKKIRPKDVLYEISRTGETVVKFIYFVGLTVENTVKAFFLFISRLFIRIIKFIYKTGEYVILYSTKLARFIKNIVMIVPKSLARDYSYWACAASAVIVVSALFLANTHTLALKVTVNGETAGYVSSEDEFTNVVGKVEDEIAREIDEKYVMRSTPEYAFTLVNKEKVEQERKVEETEIFNNVLSIVCDEIGKHYGLYVDGELVAATENEETITSILEDLKEPYQTGKENESVEFVAQVEVKKSLFAPHYLKTDDELRAMFSSSTDPKYYTIQEDDYLSDISKATGLSKSQLHALNPGLDETRLVPGKKLNISKPDVYLGIKIVKTISYTEDIAYETKKIEDSSMYKTKTKVKKAGVKGEKAITAEVTYVDGVQVSKKILSEEVTREPVTQELYVGTKALPVTTSPLAGTGTFIRPINGGYTSCGYRGYRGHSGVDLTMSGAYGKPVYASASGTVIYAGWSGGYGKTVRIKHSGGYTTVYAHMSSINVSVGDSVYQGQQVGRIGSTGNSTGPHLHFELRINGSAVNPMRYIG
ncbi:MAG: peptidoglycan DD-metalloendopeptidase family protein [Clostridia bacterium]|nr:peptidoglycan DD-metalloendopeptidase family protein [Clostridia bacterium]